jgi:hypothetical protein
MNVETLTAADSERWNTYATRSPQATLFHQYEALQVQAKHADATLHALAGVLAATEPPRAVSRAGAVEYGQTHTAKARETAQALRRPPSQRGGGRGTVQQNRPAALRWVVDRVNERFTEQGESTPLTAKFGPEVQSYHNMRRTSRSIGTVAGIYRRIQNGGGLLG